MTLAGPSQASSAAACAATAAAPSAPMSSSSRGDTTSPEARCAQPSTTRATPTTRSGPMFPVRSNSSGACGPRYHDRRTATPSASGPARSSSAGNLGRASAGELEVVRERDPRLSVQVDLRDRQGRERRLGLGARPSRPPLQVGGQPRPESGQPSPRQFRPRGAGVEPRADRPAPSSSVAEASCVPGAPSISPAAADAMSPPGAWKASSADRLQPRVRQEPPPNCPDDQPPRRCPRTVRTPSAAISTSVPAT